jgi:hypothetical protein
MCVGEGKSEILLMRAFSHSFSASEKSCFHWNRARDLLMSGRTFMHVGLVSFSSSMAVSNFSMASWYLPWSNRSSP